MRDVVRHPRNPVLEQIDAAPHVGEGSHLQDLCHTAVLDSISIGLDDMAKLKKDLRIMPCSSDHLLLDAGMQAIFNPTWFPNYSWY